MYYIVVKPWYFIINEINKCIDEKNKNAFLTRLHGDKNKKILKSMKNYGRKSNILLDQ